MSQMKRVAERPRERERQSIADGDAERKELGWLHSERNRKKS